MAQFAIDEILTTGIAISGFVFDVSNNIGANGYVLTSTSSGVMWQADSNNADLSLLSGQIAATGTLLNNRIDSLSGYVNGNFVSGSGVANYVARWSNTKELLTGSIYDLGTGIGIGTTSPAAKLEVKGADDAVITAIFQSFAGNPAYNGGIQLGNAVANQNSQIYHSSAGDNTLTFVSNYSQGTANKFIFAPGGTETVRFQQNGRVGIGNAAPATLLSVGGAGSTSATSGITFGADSQANLYRISSSRIKTDGNFTIDGQGGGSTSLVLNRSSTSSENGMAFNTAGSTDWYFYVDNGNNNLQIQRSSEIDSAPRVRFDGENSNVLFNLGGGNVGIGTASPNTKLRISGSFSQRASGTTAIQEYKNILTYNSDNYSDGAYVVRTPFQIGNSYEMPIVHVKGYGYGDAKLYDFKVVFYDYGPSHSPISYSLIDLGNDGSPKYLAKDASNYINVCFGQTGDVHYYYRFTVDCITTRQENDYSQGWGMYQTKVANFGFASTGIYALSSPVNFNVANNFVGIGKTNPSAKLDVVGNIYLSADIVGNDGTRGYLLGKDSLAGGRSYLILDPDAADGVGVGSDYLYIAQENTTGVISNTTAGPLLLNPGGGNVGVGTVNPSYNLDVIGTVRASGELISEGNNARISLFRLGGINYFDWASGQSLYFSTESSVGGAGRNTVMSITSGGNVGVGTVNAVAPIHIGGNASNNDPWMVLDVNDTFFKRIVFSEERPTYGTTTYGGYIGYDASANTVSLGTYENSVEKRSINILRDNGYVGIGITDPSNKLHISGGGISFTTSTGLAVPMIGLTAVNVAYIGPYSTSTDGNAPTLVVFNQGSSVQQTYFYSSGRIAMVLNKEGRLNIAGNAGNTPPALLNVGPTSSVAAVSGMSFGNDSSANLYRSALGALKTDGSLGIGINPVQKLQVDGEVGNPALNGTTQSGIFRISNATDNAVLDFGIRAGGLGAWIQSTDETSLSATYPLLLNPNGGSVGIGITNPSGQLHLKNMGFTNQDTVPDTNLFPNASGVFGLVMDHDTYTNGLYRHRFIKVDRSANIPLYLQQAGSVAHQYINLVRFGTHSQSTDTFEVFGDSRINGSVNVTSTLSTSGSINIGTDLYVSGQLGVGVPIANKRLNYGAEIKANNFSIQLVLGRIGAVSGLGAIGADANNTFAVWNVSGQTTRQFVVTQQGNVGIGSASPVSRLDVNGTIALSGYSFADRFAVYNRVWNPELPSIYLGDSSDPTNYYDNTTHIFRARGAGAERMRITTAGNVGIGSESPTQKLDVSGTLKIKSAGTYSDPTDNAGFLNYDTVGGIFTLSARSDAGNTYMAFRTSNGGTGSEKVRITNNGLVGISSNAPTDFLDFGGAGKNIVFGYAAYGEVLNSAASIIGNNVKASPTANSQVRRFASANDQGNFIKLIYNKGVTFHTNIISALNTDISEDTNERMRINLSGDVGIGAINPIYRLQLQANNPTNGVLAQFYNFNAGAAGANGAFTIWTQYGIADWFIGQPSGVNALTFGRDKTSSATGVEYMRINSAGNVGVGTISPAASLHIKPNTISANTFIIERYASTAKLIYAYESGADGYLEVRNGSDQAVSRIAGYSTTPTYFQSSVGVGTTSPSVKLAVNGEASFGDDSKLTLIGLDINSGATPSFIKIRTKIPFASPAADFTINIKGFRYNSAEAASLMVCWHYYNSTFYSPAISSAGSFAPIVKLSAEDWDSSGTPKVCIVLVGPGYWPKLYVESMYSSSYNDDYADGWDWVDADATGTGNNLAILAYKSNFGNDFVMLGNGNVGIGITNPSNKVHISGGGISFTTSTGLAVPMLGIVLPTNVAYIGPYATTAGGVSPSLVLFNQGASVQQTWFYSSGRVAMVLNKEGRLHIGSTNNTPNCLLSVGPTNSTLPDSGICFGNDAQANLYRSAEDVIKTDGSLIVTNSLGLGISPTQKLQVDGVVGNPALNGTTQSGIFRISNTTDNAVLDFGIRAGGSGAWIQSTDETSLDAYYPLLLNPNGGNVGIGTITANHKLDLNIGTISTNPTTFGYNVFGNATSNVGYCGYNLQLNNSTANATAYLRLARTSATAYLGLEIASQSRDGIRFLTHATAPVEVARITNEGNVGIGTVTANSILELYKVPATSGTLQPMLTITSDYPSAITTNFGSSIIFKGRTAGNVLQDNAQIAAYNEDVQDNGYALGFYTRPTVAGGLTQRMTILRGGNVGISSTSPAERLDVNGYILNRSKFAYTQRNDIVKNGLSFYVDFNNKTCFDSVVSASSIKDLSNNNYALALVNAATISNKDGNTSLYTANNSSYLQIASYVMALPHTWEAWVNGDAFATGGSGWDTIWDSGGLGIERPLIGVINGVLNVYPNTNNCGTLTAGKWYHIVVTTDASSNINTYINGVLTATFAYVSTFNVGTGAIWLGGDTTVETFNGYIPIARTYNRVLSITEVMQNYNAEKWRFDNNSTFYHDVAVGRVGIDTTSPNAKLQIAGTTASLLTVGTLTNDWGGVVAIGTPNGNGIILSKVNTTNDTNRVLTLMRDDTNGASIFGYTPVGTSTSVGFQIRASASSYFNGGNVGIGQTSPLEKLQVQGNIYATDGALFNFKAQRIPIEGNPQGGTYKGYLILAKAYTSGFLEASYVIGKVILRRGTSGTGHNVDIYEVNSSRGYNTEIFQVSRLGAIGTRFVRLVKVTYGGVVYHAIETSDSGGQPSTEMYFEGSIIDSPLILTDASFVSNVTAFGNGVIFVDQSSNIGIGTTSPDAALHVRGDQVYLYNDLNTNNTYFYARNSSAGNAGIKMKNSDGEWTIIANDRLRFIDDDAGVERLSILSNGNIGIGTTDPAGLLHVFSNNGRYINFTPISVSGLLIQRNQNIGSQGTTVLTLVNAQGPDTLVNRGTSLNLDIGYGGTSTTTAGTIARGARIAALNHNTYSSTAADQNAYLAFYTATGGSLTEKVRIQADGKVGIGISSPITLLSVGGAGSTTAVSGMCFGNDAEANLYRSAEDTIKTDGNLIVVGNVTAANLVSGNGTANYITKWNDTKSIANSQIFDDGTYVGVNTAVNTTYRLQVNGSFAATTKSFDIVHPTISGKRLIYASLEGPENGVYFRGRNNNNEINLPHYWSGLVHDDSITVDLTSVGKRKDGKIRNYSVDQIGHNKVYIHTDSDDNIYDYYYTIFAERKDVSRLITERDME